MPQIPAICDDCGTVFPSGIVMEGGSAYMAGNKSGPCPNCGAMGSIPDGFYDFIGKTLRIVSDWTPERRRQLVAELKEARRASDPRSATAAAIEKQPELCEVARRLLVPRDPAEFWAFVAALLALLALILGQSDQEITIKETDVIETIMGDSKPSVPSKADPSP